MPVPVDESARIRTMGGMERMLESTVGKWCIVAYTLFTIGAYMVSATCGAEWCGLAIVWPILPWAFIMANDLGLAFPWVMYPVFVLLNVSVAYVLGVGAEWLYHRVHEGTATRDA